jgi:hypothetical protein
MDNCVGLAAALIGAVFASSLSVASTTDASATDASAQHNAADESSQCTSLDSEWKTAEAACATNANLGRARALAREAETKCKSPEAAQRKLGVSKYQSALRLCRKGGGAH